MPLLTATEERALLARAQQGDQPARDELVLRNRNLVWAVVRKCKRAREGMEDEDLYMEGIIGLVTAIDKFDLSKTVRFSTYAHHWVRQFIGRAIDNQGRMIRLPTHVIDRLRGVSEEELPGYARDCWSLDHEVTKEEEHRVNEVSRLSVFLACPDDTESEVVASLAWETGPILQAIGLLPDRERHVIQENYGLDDEDCKSLQQIGKECDPPITRERVRQLRQAGLKRLRNILAQRAESEY